MTSQQILNTAGLVLGMVGVLIIFRFGPPQPNFETGVPLSVEDGTPLPSGETAGQYAKRVVAERARYSRFSKAGLVLVFFGFALQLVATWL